MNNNLHNLLLLVILLVILTGFIDIHLTMVGVNKGGLEMEGNPLVKKIIEKEPLIWISFKVIMSILMLGLCFLVTIGEFNTKRILKICIISFSGILVFNLFIILTWGIYILK